VITKLTPTPQKYREIYLSSRSSRLKPSSFLQLHDRLAWRFERPAAGWLGLRNLKPSHQAVKPAGLLTSMALLPLVSSDFCLQFCCGRPKALRELLLLAAR
jgi:hypothetical protein